ncbi:MAG: DUF4340 domain-containing protein [Planctomycetota bacterium]
MRFRTTLILLLILAVVGLTAFFWPEVEQEETGEVAQLFPDFRRQSCERLELSSPESATMTIVRMRGEVDIWQIETPFVAEADDEFIDGVLRDLENAYRYEETAGGTLADYGLESPRLKLTFELDGGDSHTLHFGDVDPRLKEKSDIFVRIDDDETVYRTKRVLYDALSRQKDELRERSVISPKLMTIFDVQQFEIHDESRIVFARQVAGQWEIEKPITAPGSMPEIRTFLGTVLSLQIDRFAADQPDDRAPFGLEPPRGRIVLASGPDKAAQRVELLVGGEDPEKEGNVFVAIEGRDSVYSVVDDQGELRPKVSETVLFTGSDLRDPRLFGAVRYSAQELEVKGPGDVRWVLGRPDLEWEILEPIRRRADAASVGQLLDRLDLASFKGFIDEPKDLAAYGLAEPAVEMRLAYGDPVRTAEVHLGSIDGDAQFVRRVDQGTVGQVQETAFDFLGLEFWPYIERPFWRLDPAAITALEIEMGDQSRRFTRSGDGWQSGATPDDAIEAVLERLVMLSGDEVFERRPEQGLESPAARVRLEIGTEQHVLLIGLPSNDRDIYRFAALEGAPESKTVESSILRDLESLVK